MPFPFREGMSGRRVELIQEWLCLRGTGVLIDGKFGPATTYAVKLFQTADGTLNVDGVVGAATWDALIRPMTEARTILPANGRTLSEMVVAHAEAHLAQNAREVGGQNRGPWVREYMAGIDGEKRKWCAGFASYCLAQAAASTGREKPLQREFSVPLLVAKAKRAGLFVEKPKESERAVIKPGSFFVTRGGRFGWNHVGIVTRIDADVFLTIEGNSNDDLQTRSYEVCRRIRSYEFSTKDFIVFS